MARGRADLTGAPVSGGFAVRGVQMASRDASPRMRVPDHVCPCCAGHHTGYINAASAKALLDGGASDTTLVRTCPVKNESYQITVHIPAG